MGVSSHFPYDGRRQHQAVFLLVFFAAHTVARKIPGRASEGRGRAGDSLSSEIISSFLPQKRKLINQMHA